MTRKLRIAVVGSGFAAHFHLASYRRVHDGRFEVAAICGTSPEKTARLAQEYGISRQFEDFGALLEERDIDAIDLCVPNSLHVPFVLRAIRQQKHVICEKPLGGFFGPPDATDDWSARDYPRDRMLHAVLEQAEEVRQAVRSAGVVFCYAENWVYAPPIVKLNRLMAASGSSILSIQGEESHSGSHAAYSRRWRTAGGGSLLRLCVHPVGAALHLKHEEGRRRDGRPVRPRSVTAQVAQLTHIESFRREEPKHIVTGWQDVEDWGAITIEFDDGSVAQLTSTDTRLGGIRNYITAYGSRALVTANINPNDACKAYTPDGRYFDSEYLVEKTETKAGWSFPAPDEDAVTGYPAELGDFVSAMVEGRGPASGLMLATDVLIVIYAAYLSAAERRTIDVDRYL